jgi:capsular exopolysaccharide synthesis family protein
MDISSYPEPFKEAAKSEAGTSGAALSVLRTPTSTARLEYDVDRCREYKILVPDVAESQPAASAAYRVLRTRFVQRARTHLWTSVGISSPGPGEGKSVTALNLALSVALAGNHDVYLIDLDLRRPKMWQYLGTTPPRGITDYLTGDAPADEILFSTDIKNLTFAGAIAGTNKASELLSGPRVPELFSHINRKASNALILVDLPPLLSTDDALIMGALVDACLLVISEGRSRRDGTLKALELLEDFQDIAGLVLNRSNTMVTDYYAAY